MNQRIHPTAIVDPGAELGEDVEIGPYSIVGPKAKLAARVRLVSHVVIENATEIGEDTLIHPFAVLGGHPQHVAYKGEDTHLVIGARNRIREHVTMHTGTVAGGGVTRVGSDSMFMVASHVAHDCVVGDGVIFANNATLGGHVHIDDFVFMGGLSAVHQFTRIGRFAFAGGGAIVTKDVIPFGSVWGSQAVLGGLNLVGLRRRGFSREAINDLRAAYRLLFAPEGTFAERLEDVAEAYKDSPEVKEIVAFIRADANRPICLPAPDRMAARKLGLIAGAGDLPRTLAARCEAAGRGLYVIRLRGFADAGYERYDGADCGLGEFGRCFELLRRAGCEAVCFAGHVAKPDFGKLKPDLRGVAILPSLVAGALKGDDGLLRAVLKAFESEGFAIEGADEVDASLTLPKGALGEIAPKPEHQSDIVRALSIARAAGSLDIGQGAVVAGGVVLAVEAQEGTDAMLRRCAELPAEIRGTRERPLGVLAKAPKPIQERRVDLPTLGPATIEAAAAAGLAGVVGEAGGALVLDREAVIAAADRLGLFVWGAPPP